MILSQAAMIQYPLLGLHCRSYADFKLEKNIYLKVVCLCREAEMVIAELTHTRAEHRRRVEAKARAKAARSH